MSAAIMADMLPVSFVSFNPVSAETAACPYYRILWSDEDRTEKMYLIKPSASLGLREKHSLTKSVSFFSSYLDSCKWWTESAGPLTVPVLSDYAGALLVQLTEFHIKAADVHSRLRISLLIMALLTEILINRTVKKEAKHPIRSMDGKTIVYAAHFMKKHMANPDLSLKVIADAVGYNSNYFCQIFSSVLSETPIKYLNRLRMEKVLKLLEETDYSVQTICSMAGIRNPSNLSMLVKKKVGMTPVEYRRSLKLQSIHESLIKDRVIWDDGKERLLDVQGINY